MAKVTTIRLEDNLLAALDQLAAAMDRPRAWLVEQAIARYVEEEGWQVLAIKEALDEYQAGRSTLVPHEQVMTDIEARLREQLDVADRLA